MLRITENTVCSKPIKINGIEALCTFLKCFTYPCRYLEMVSRFAGPIPQIYMTTNNIMNANFYFKKSWLAPQQLSIYANVIHAKGAALKNC